MQNYPIDLKVNDPLFMQLIENFSTVPQTRKNTASHMRKLVSRTGRSPFYINHDDAKNFTNPALQIFTIKLMNHFILKELCSR